MLLAALARPQRVAGLVGIAAAPDFTEELLWTRLTPAQRREIHERSHIVLPSEFDRAGYLYTRALIEDGRKHLLLGQPDPGRGAGAAVARDARRVRSVAAQP